MSENPMMNQSYQPMSTGGNLAPMHANVNPPPMHANVNPPMHASANPPPGLSALSNAPPKFHAAPMMAGPACGHPPHTMVGPLHHRPYPLSAEGILVLFILLVIVTRCYRPFRR